MILHPQTLYRAYQACRDPKTFLLSLDRDISDMPTLMMAAVSPQSTEKLAPCLPTDQEGRCYVKIISLEALTIDLADLAVSCFLDATGVYPDELIACPSRMARLNTYYFFPKGHLPIPFTRDFMYPIDYDILARGYV